MVVRKKYITKSDKNLYNEAKMIIITKVMMRS